MDLRIQSLASMFDIFEADLTVPEQGAALLQLMREYARDPMGGGEDLSEFVQENLKGGVIITTLD